MQSLLRLFLVFGCCLFGTSAKINGKCIDNSGSLTKRYFYIGEQTLDLRLEVSDRISHQLITNILKILLEEVFGYVNISLVEKLDYMNATLVLDRITGCPLNGSVGCPMAFEPQISLHDCSNPSSRCKNMVRWQESNIPETMINLEVWMGPGFNTESWVGTGRLEHCGPLGPVGRFGWFLPQYLVKDGWNKQLIYDHWKALQDENVVRLLDLSEDMSIIKQYARIEGSVTNETYCSFKGCKDGIYYPSTCRNGATCATLLSKYPAISNGMIRKLIDHLNLRVKVAWIGPRLESYVHRRTSERKPVMFFSWKPNSITSSRDFTNIAFPRCEDLPIGSAFPSNCAFEINQLNKIVWAGLKDSAVEAVHVVRAMSFTQVQYQQLIAEYERKKVNGQQIGDVACQWIRKNKAIWSHWIPDNLSDKTTVYIGGIFPLSGLNYISKGIIPAVEMAIEAVNRNNSVLKDHRLALMVEDGKCSPDHVMKAFIKYVTSREFSRIVGILGPACSDTVEALAGVAKHYHSTIISYSAEGAIFNNNKDYPYFFRTIPSNKQFKYVYLPLFQRLGWTRVATLTEEGMKYPEYLSLTQDFLQSHGINFIVNRKFPKDRSSNNMTQYLDDLKKKNVRIIIGDVYDTAARAIMCEAYRQGMTAHQGYVWFFPRWFARNWYDTDIYNSLESSAAHKIRCTRKEMLRAINGYMSLAYTYFNDDHKIMQEGITVRDWRNNYYDKMADEDNKPDEYAGYAYDAVWVYALGLDKLLRRNHSSIATLHTDKTARKFVEILNGTNFQGVSGQIRFVGPSRVSVIYVLQWVNNRTNKVGRYVPQPSGDGILELNDTSIVWFTSNHRVPDDGREVPGQCAIEVLRNLLDVDCDVAIVVTNIVGFVLFAVVMLCVFVVFKLRYEKRVRMTEQRMKELGLITANNMFALDQWEIPRECVIINRKIGEGAFGTVFGGEVHFDDVGWVPVAVKTLKIGSTIEEKLDFLSEAEMMKRFDHENIVRLLGVCTRGEPVYTIMEFMLYGDLKTFLLGRRHLVSEKIRNDSDEVCEQKLTSMALDVARGLSYLAEMKYVHRDLACRNCLVNTSRTVKIGDFGMTRPMYDSDYYRFNKKGMLPVRWMAPESLADGLFTPMSDVWSYGVLLFEIITFGSFPFQGLSNNQVLDYVKKGNKLDVPTGCSPQMEELLQKCWSQDPQMRPTAQSIVDILSNSPQLVSPCLDLPSAVVEIEGTDSLELQLLERARKYSVSNANRVQPRKRSDTLDNGVESTPLCPMLGTPNGTLPRTPISLELNGGLSSSSPVHSTTHCALNSPSSHARYVTLQHNKDGKNSPDSIKGRDGRRVCNATCL